MKKVVCFGEVLWDNFPSGKKPGGAPMNVALHLFKNAVQSTLISSIGNDSSGKELKTFLEVHGLSTHLVQLNTHQPTGIVKVELDQNQHAKYTIVKPVAWDEIEFSTAQAEEVKHADALVFGSLLSRSETTRNTLFKLFPYARFKVLDLNLRSPHFEKELIIELIRNCNFLKINEDEIIFLKDLLQIEVQEEDIILKKIAEKFAVETICVTLGERGAIALHQNKIFTHPGFPVKVADTVGAGDAFLATFISGLLKELPIEQNLALACAAGALVASKPGANPDYSIDDISRFLI